MPILQLLLFTIYFSTGSLEHPEIPVIKHMYTADPSAHSWDGKTLYLYPSHDIAPPRGCDLMDKYHVFSTTDMVNWKDEGQILEAADLPWRRPEGGYMWAPDAAYKNGQYYFYFPHPNETDTGNSWQIGVAVSTEPASGFKQVGYIPDITELGGGRNLYDPCVFVDDDGQAYLYTGGGQRINAGKLKDSMVELDGPMIALEDQLPEFHEGPFVWKRNGQYYMMYPDNHQPYNQMHYATAADPLGPWRYQGIFLGGTGCDTTHGSVVEFKGNWYIFFHNVALSGKGNMRSVSVAPLAYNADGTIVRYDPPYVKSVDVAPLPNKEAPDVEKVNEFFVREYGHIGEKCIIEHAEAYGGALCNFHLEGSWATFSGFNLPAGQYYLYLRYSGYEGHIIAAVNGKYLDSGFMMISNESWDDFTVYTDPQMVTLDGGEVVVRLEGGNGSINILSVIFERV